MIFSSPEFKVGMLVVGISALIGVMSMQISEDPGFMGGSKKAWFLVPDAGGLLKNSAVKMAGIDVGIIKDIYLEKGIAHIDLAIKKNVPLTKKTHVEIKSNGILGDKYIEIVSEETDATPLEEGGQISTVSGQATLDNVLGKAGSMIDNLKIVAERLKTATDATSDVSHPLGRIIHNVETITADIAKITSDKRDKIEEIVDQIHGITQSLDDVMNREGENGFRATWNELSSAIRKIEKTSDNLEKITAKVQKGEGTIGRLVNDDSTAEKIDTALTGVNQFLGAAGKLETSFDFHSDYLSYWGATKSFLGVRLQPGLDRYYDIQIVDDPEGVIEITNTSTVTDGAPEVIEDQKKTFKKKVKLTALFAKTFHNFAVKGGMIENSGGFGFDYFLFKRRLQLSFDAFNFTESHMRAYAKYSFFPGIYVTGGADNFANKEKSSAYVGAGLFLTNEDLKVFMSKMSF